MLNSSLEKRKKAFPAHRVLLALASPVLAKLLFTPEHKNPLEKLTIRLPEVKPATFGALLKALYQGSPIPTEELNAVLKLSSDWQIEVLKSSITASLETSLTLDKSYGLLTSALKENKSLAGAVLTLAARSAGSFVTGDGWLTLPKTVLAEFVPRDDLGCTEEQLFEALVNWGKAECKREGKEATPANMKAVLSDLLPHIRFPLFNMLELSTKIIPTGLLDEMDLVALFTHKGSEGASGLPLPFKSVPRIPTAGSLLLVATEEGLVPVAQVPVAPPL